MEIEGVVVDVMESWPLQLTVVDSAENRYHIMLDMDTITVHNDLEHIDYEFRPKQQIHIIGRPFEDNILTAEKITILGSNKE